MIKIGLKIADLVFEYQTSLGFPAPVRSNFQPFLTTEPPFIRIAVETGEFPDLAQWQLIFDAHGTWQLHHRPGNWALSIFSPLFPQSRFQTLVLDEALRQGVLITMPPSPGQLLTDLISTMLEKLLVITLSAHRLGIMVHASAVADNRTGRLFCGVSGDGKSTMAHFWKDQAGVQILSDERVILRKLAGRFWIFGAPWHSNVSLVSAQGAPLDQCFILRQADQHQVELLSSSQALSQLLVRVFPPYWDPEGMDFTLSFLSELTTTLPCRLLGFKPQPDVVAYVRTLA